MSERSQNNTDNQEVDLSIISKKIGNFFEDISTKIFRGILFLKRNILWLAILFIVGAGLGFYLDKTTTLYDNQVIVSPNFGSVDYLYAKIDLINSKVEDNDIAFLRDVVGLKNATEFGKIKITPVVDLYRFIGEKDQNFDLIKLMAEEGDVKKIAGEPLTSRNYPYHLISFSTSKKTTDKGTIQPLLNYLNDSEYYKKIQKEVVNNIKVKMVENDSIILQINGFLNSFSHTNNGLQKNDKLVYYNENTQLNDVIKTKDALIAEQGSNRLSLINSDEIIKENSATVNIKNTANINGNLKLVFPFLFIVIFILVGMFRAYYRRQMAKMNT